MYLSKDQLEISMILDLDLSRTINHINIEDVLQMTPTKGIHFLIAALQKEAGINNFSLYGDSSFRYRIQLICRINFYTMIFSKTSLDPSLGSKYDL